MGALGCCSRKPQTLKNEDIVQPVESVYAPPVNNSGYQVEYIPPNQASSQHYAPSQYSEAGIIHNSVSMNPQLEDASYKGNDTSKKIRVNDASVNHGGSRDLEIVQVDIFRESRVEPPKTMPVSVEFRDLEILKRLR